MTHTYKPLVASLFEPKESEYMGISTLKELKQKRAMKQAKVDDFLRLQNIVRGRRERCVYAAMGYL